MLDLVGQRLLLEIVRTKGLNTDEERKTGTKEEGWNMQLEKRRGEIKEEGHETRREKGKGKRIDRRRAVKNKAERRKMTKLNGEISMGEERSQKDEKRDQEETENQRK